MYKYNKLKMENGITLISLILTIVILVILSAVILKSFTGDEGIISMAEVTAQDYDVMQYKEQIEQITQSTIVMYSASGGEVGLNEIANNIKSEGSMWVSKTSVNLDESLSNPDVLVTTIEGYVFQIYYDNIYGVVNVEYIGLSKNGSFPNLTANFNNFNIETSSSIESGNITKIEIMYSGNNIDITSSNKYKVEKENMGWYKVRAVANNGNVRYAWIKTNIILDNLKVPNITITPMVPDGKENWYITEPNLNIKTENNPLATTIYYNIIGSINESSNINASGEVNIKLNKCGIARVTAWVEDDSGGRSKEITKVIKFDNTKPTVTASIEAELTSSNGWIKSTGEIKVKVEDEGIVDGYEYEVLDKNLNKIRELTYVSDVNKTIKVETDGEYVINIRGIDKAGNKSELPVVLNVKKDTSPPEIGTPVLDSNSITDKEFTISIAAKDKASGIDKYEFYVNGNLFVTKEIGVCNINNLQPDTAYEVYVVVYDNVGLSEKSMYISAITKKEGYNSGGNTGGEGSDGDNGDEGNKDDNTGGNVKVDGDNVTIGDVTTTKSELIGKYINYQPEGSTYNETITIESTSETYNFEPESMLWQIWTIDKDKMYLISSLPTTSKLTLKGNWRL